MSFKYLLCDRCEHYWKLEWKDTRDMVEKIKKANLCPCCGSRKVVVA